MKEFTIKDNENQFRFKDVSPLKILALRTTIDFDDMSKTEKLFSFILENTEVFISGTWVNVKDLGREVYFPVGIENDLDTLMNICTTFLNEIVKPTFTKSRE